MTEVDIENNPAWPGIEAWCRDLLRYPASVEITGADLARAMELARAESDLLDATADVLNRSFMDLAAEFDTWPDNNPPEGS